MKQLVSVGSKIDFNVGKTNFTLTKMFLLFMEKYVQVLKALIWTFTTSKEVIFSVKQPWLLRLLNPIFKL